MTETTLTRMRGISRRSALLGGAGAALAAPFVQANAADDTAFVGITLPLTGTYAVQGEDELKGFELAIEHINAGNELIRKISPLTKKGVLGKMLKAGHADSGAKPNVAVQNAQRFISENKAVVFGGCVSSAEAVALNKIAQQNKVIYLPGISGSNDTTGKDCARYSFRQCFYGQTAAAAISPVIVKALGPNKKVAYLTPDYTYGHTVHQSMEAAVKSAGWTTATNQVAPLGAPDYSSYLLNIANSGADVFININFGNDAVLSIKQAKQFGILGKATLVVPYNTPFLAKQVGAELMAGVYAATDFWWTLEDKYPVAKMFVAEFEAKYKYKPEWGANSAYMQMAMWADAVERAKSWEQAKIVGAYEAGHHYDSTVGDVYFRAADHQLVRPVIIERGKKPAEMKNADDYYEIVEIVPGLPLMQAPDAFGCKLGSV
jgi:branched-chain amino acid transport system substrate-binding protein